MAVDLPRTIRAWIAIIAISDDNTTANYRAQDRAEDRANT
jgi:hypothetical protein